ncbi:hypothetical protein ABTE58_19215, partial [Acinetobacter baumannii]
LFAFDIPGVNLTGCKNPRLETVYDFHDVSGVIDFVQSATLGRISERFGFPEQHDDFFRNAVGRAALSLANEA